MMDAEQVTEACEMGLCGNCYKGRDQAGGWCECDCHPPKAVAIIIGIADAWAAPFERFWRRILRRPAGGRISPDNNRP